ncbi:hypothetical protein [Lactiplantibacillus daowaiensis]|uniref:Extracellular protein n=1 Tax=Lactiplantibacillus daowaiensis TaxID=2559918 RepID=A0ABW1RZ91_9LACO|nr:hypothetical protein [Lactiplantibacillus daowaiensis]
MLKKYSFGLLVIATTALGIAASHPTTVHATSHSTIPTSLRGTWYQANTTYNQHGKAVLKKGYQVIKLSKHTVTTWASNDRGRRTSKKLVILASKYHNDYRHLYVTKGPLFNKQRYVYNLPDMNLQAVQPAGRKNTIGFTDGWGFWTTHKTYKHHNYHLLGAYQRQGYVEYWANKRVHHIFSYTTMSQHKLNQLGFKK